MACEVTDLPEPDSPTMPTVSPGAMSNETPRTASTSPSSVGNVTLRSRTDSSSVIAACGDPGDLP